MANKRRSREFWEQVVDAFESGAATQKQLAHRHRVSVSAVQFWIYRLRREGKKRRKPSRKASPQLLPVRVSELPVATRLIEVQVEQLRMRFPEGTTPRYLAEIVQAMRSC